MMRGHDHHTADQVLLMAASVVGLLFVSAVLMTAAGSCRSSRLPVATPAVRSTRCALAVDRYCERFNPRKLEWEQAPVRALLYPNEWRGSCQPRDCDAYFDDSPVRQPSLR